MKPYEMSKKDLFNVIKDSKEMQEIIAFQLYIIQVERLMKLCNLDYYQSLKLGKILAERQFKSIFN